MKLVTRFVLFVLFSLSITHTLVCAQEITTATDSSSSTPTIPTTNNSNEKPTETEAAATRTISVQEASAIAEQQSENPSAFLNDPETQKVLGELQGWINGMLGSGGGEGEDNFDPQPQPEEGEQEEPFEDSEGDIVDDCDDEEPDQPQEDSGNNNNGGGSQVENCTRTFVPISGMTCDSAEDDMGLERGTIIKLNPEVNDKCTNMIAGDTYCIEVAT